MLGRILILMACIAVGNVLVAQPANDECANAIPINGSVTDFDFSTVDATTGLPYHPGECQGGAPDSMYNDIWYLYTADFTGETEVSTCGTAFFDTNIAVYEPGSPCPPTVDNLLVCSEDAVGCAGSTSRAIFDAVEGETYLVRIGGWGTDTPGEEGLGSLTIGEYVPPMGPENDFCENAIEIILDADDFAQLDFSTVGASTDSPTYEETFDCFDVPNGETNVFNDIWYTWTATFSGFAAFSNCSMANFDSRIAVYGPDENCMPDPFALVGCSDDGIDEDGNNCTNFTSRAVFPVVEGSTYLMSIGGWSSSGAGFGMVTLERVPPPVPPDNDNCADADSAWVVTMEEADNFEVFFESFTTNASLEPTPNPSCRPTGEFFDVWYTFNSGNNTDLELRFNKTTPDADFVINLYNTCAIETDTLSEGFCIRTDEYEGETFIIEQLTGFPGEPTEYLLRVSTRVTTDTPGEFFFQLVGEPFSNIPDIGLKGFEFFPNPVNQNATINFELEEPTMMSIALINAVGQEVSTEALGRLPAGPQSLQIPTDQLKPGMYFMRIQTPEGQQTTKFIKQ